MAFRGALMLNGQDNIAVCLEDFGAGNHVEVRLGEEAFVIEATEDIPCGFKIALEDIPPGCLILKFGEPIGVASVAISKGQQAHVHNIEGARGRGDLAGGGAA